MNNKIQSSDCSENKSSDLTSLASNLPHNTANRLTAISAKAVYALELARKFSRRPWRFVSEKEIHELLRLALEVNSQLGEWAESAPESWTWQPAAGLNCPTEKPREYFVYGKRIDFYVDLNMAGIWNSYRSTRILILSTVLDCISQVKEPIDENLLHHTAVAVRTIQELIDDICASVPYHMGTKICAGTIDKACVEYPFTTDAKFLPEQRRKAAALAGWLLLEPLKAGLSVTSLRRGQKEWIKNQLVRVGRCYKVDLLAACQRQQSR